MKTVKLYDENPYIKEFSARVLSCEKAQNGYALILDKTAFFPEEGGQPSDTGFIEKSAVSAVFEKKGVITHIADAPVKAGETVNCRIDFERRFGFMQNHSGEHIVSGIAHRLYGFDNVGFHLGESFATVDFNGILSREMLDEVEKAANEAVYENCEIIAFYPDKNTIEGMNYRSKKDIEGDIRIVEIKGIDLCACCAPHVARTGEIGVIKLLESSKMRGGTRVVLKCGRYALSDYKNRFENTREISEMLSSKDEFAAKAVRNLIDKTDNIKQQNNELKKRIIDSIIKMSADKKVIFEDNLDIKELQMLADGLHKAKGGIRAAFSRGENGYNFALCGEEQMLSDVFAAFKTALSARGGGRGEMVQGSVVADKGEIIEFFEERL